MMCGMCEAHMNELIRNNFKVKKVSSSAKDGETVVISEDALDIPWAKNKIKEIGYELVSYESEPYEKKGCFLILSHVNDQPMRVIKVLGENPGACPWDEAKKYFSKSLMSISSEYTLQI